MTLLYSAELNFNVAETLNKRTSSQSEFHCSTRYFLAYKTSVNVVKWLLPIEDLNLFFFRPNWKEKSPFVIHFQSALAFPSLVSCFSSSVLVIRNSERIFQLSVYLKYLLFYAFRFDCILYINFPHNHCKTAWQFSLDVLPQKFNVFWMKIIIRSPEEEANESELNSVYSV